MMAFIFYDENFPESTEYMSNYEYFDETKPGAIAQMMRKCLEFERNKNKESHQHELLHLSQEMMYSKAPACRIAKPHLWAGIRIPKKEFENESASAPETEVVLA